jgi:hypothetical protein
MFLFYLVFGFFIGVFVRRTGIALIIYFGYSIVGELILRYLVHMNLFKNKSMHFYPENGAEDLMPLPFGEMASRFIQQNQFSFFLTKEEAVITTLIYISIFLLLVFWKIRKADL